MPRTPAPQSRAERPRPLDSAMRHSNGERAQRRQCATRGQVLEERGFGRRGGDEERQRAAAPCRRRGLHTAWAGGRRCRLSRLPAFSAAVSSCAVSSLFSRLVPSVLCLLSSSACHLVTSCLSPRACDSWSECPWLPFPCLSILSHTVTNSLGNKPHRVRAHTH